MLYGKYELSILLLFKTVYFSKKHRCLLKGPLALGLLFLFNSAVRRMHFSSIEEKCRLSGVSEMRHSHAGTALLAKYSPFFACVRRLQIVD
jgi:hypothetical protein